MLTLFKSTIGQVSLFFILLLGLGVALWCQREVDNLEELETPIPVSQAQLKPIEITRGSAQFKKGSSHSPQTHASTPSPEPREPNFLMRNFQKLKPLADASTVPVLPLDLYTSSESFPQELSSHYLPFGRLIPCETVIGIDSSKINTPVLGLITENIYHNGQLIIPEGAEVHGKASPDRSRERIDASGIWVIVWRDHSSLNGTEMKIEGIALDRDYSFEKNAWGPSDGSSGLKGQLIQSSSWSEIQLFTSKFISAFSHRLETQQAAHPLYTHPSIPESSERNALAAGTSSVIDRYAAQLLTEIENEGFYVHVPAGTPFYLYVTQTIDLKEAHPANTAHQEIWKDYKHE